MKHIHWQAMWILTIWILGVLHRVLEEQNSSENGLRNLQVHTNCNYTRLVYNVCDEYVDYVFERDALATGYGDTWQYNVIVIIF